MAITRIMFNFPLSFLLGREASKSVCLNKTKGGDKNIDERSRMNQ